MNNLFNISSNGKIELKPETIAIPPFNEIWERDQSKTKDQATREIKYIFYLCDYTSPYRRSYSIFDLEKVIKADFIKDPKWVPDELVQRGIKKYEDLQNTISTRILASAKIGAEKLAKYFEDVDFTDLDDNGRPKFTAKELASNLAAVGNIVKSLLSLENQVRSEQMEQSNVRGKSEINDYELVEDEVLYREREI